MEEAQKEIKIAAQKSKEEAKENDLETMILN
jgi:hypothetical protein